MKLFVFIFFILIQFHNCGFTQNHKYENLVFEGAGIRGIAYSGVIKQLENQGLIKEIKNVGGTSAGALIALIVSLGYRSDEMYTIISKIKFQKFNDGGVIFFGGIYRLNKKYGWYRGEKLLQFLEKIIAAKTNNPNITFKELKESGFKNLYVTATCLNKQKLLLFSAENYPQMKLKDAVKISMSIPFYFKSVFIDSIGTVYKKPKKNTSLDIVVDGGIIGNFPIFIFDSAYIDSQQHQIRIFNQKTLGVRIDSDSQIVKDKLNKELAITPINCFTDYINAFYNIVLENLNRTYLKKEDWDRTISVSSVGISPKIKRLTLLQKMALLKSGEENTLKYFSNNNR